MIAAVAWLLVIAAFGAVVVVRERRKARAGDQRYVQDRVHAAVRNSSCPCGCGAEWWVA